jgi:hypothetical protein
LAGPGLVFALALGIVLPISAETPVGLDARGVDPLVAVENPNGLDVRDELGRPVSGKLVEAELKQAQTKAAVQAAAFSSALPRAAEVTALLEMIEALRLALRGGHASETPQRIFALAPTARELDKAPVRSLLFLAFGLLAARCWRRPASAALRSPSSLPTVLRC